MLPLDVLMIQNVHQRLHVLTSDAKILVPKAIPVPAMLNVEFQTIDLFALVLQVGAAIHKFSASNVSYIFTS